METDYYIAKYVSVVMRDNKEVPYTSYFLVDETGNMAPGTVGSGHETLTGLLESLEAQQRTAQVASSKLIEKVRGNLMPNNHIHAVSEDELSDALGKQKQK